MPQPVSITWARVRGILEQQLLPHVDAGKAALAREWIGCLGGDDPGQLLAVCMTIDLLGNALSAQDFASVLNELNPPVNPPGPAFDRAFDRHPQNRKFVCASHHSIQPLQPPDTYIRVLTLAEFTTYYVRPTYGNHYLVDPTDLAEVKETFFAHERTLEDITVWWTGGKPCVWVTSYDDVDKTVHENMSDAPTVVLDALGLTKPLEDSLEMVGVRYPQKFSVGCAKPTTLDCSWTRRGYYVSAGPADDWGETQSVSGRRLSRRERVHSEFRRLTSEYRTYHIGAARPVVGDRDALLREAATRLAALLMGTPPPPSPLEEMQA